MNAAAAGPLHARRLVGALGAAATLSQTFSGIDLTIFFALELRGYFRIIVHVDLF